MTRQNYKILSILSVLLSVYYPIVIGRLHVPLCEASPSTINVGVTNKNHPVVFLWNMVPNQQPGGPLNIQSSTVCLRQDIGIISRALFQTNFF